MLSRSKQTERLASMIEAMREKGPMSVSELVSVTGWSHETIRSQIRKSKDTFQQISDRELTPEGSVAAMFYLTNEALGMSEEELDRKEDDRYRDMKWWPKADQIVTSAMNAMVKTGEQTWHP